MTSIDLLEPIQRRRSRIKKLADQVGALERNREELQRAIADYRAFLPEIERNRIETLEAAATSLSRKLTDDEVSKKALDRRLQGVHAAKVSLLEVWKYFNAEQKKLRSEAARLALELSSINRHLATDREKLSKVRADIIAARMRISNHESFDLIASERQLSLLAPEIGRLRAGYDAENAELMRIETRIRPHTQELDRLKSEVAALNAEIALANHFEQKLSAAPNSFERAMIHKECEEKFGTGSPKQVINDRRGRIRSLENNIPKIERRLRDVLQMLERTVGHLLIDGNNACYEGQSFIGLRAISDLLRELNGRYKTTVVFDASIRAMLKTDTQGIERTLGTSVSTYVAPTKTAADEYLMKLADQDRNTFILSNDRFAEYHDYDVVKTSRVLRFLIAGGKLMVNDFDI